MRENGEIYYYHHDSLGSVTANSYLPQYQSIYFAKIPSHVFVSQFQIVANSMGLINDPFSYYNTINDVLGTGQNFFASSLYRVGNLCTINFFAH